MRKVVVVAALASALTLAVAATASADRPHHNPACAGTKIEPVVSGTYALDVDGEAGSVTITVRETAGGDVFDFATDSATHVVTSVVVKGGTALETYAYSPGVSSDTDLHASLNPSSGKWYGLSHLCFESELGDGEE